MSAPKFPLGRLYITAHAHATLTANSVWLAVRRHAIGDWGEVDDHDRQENESSLLHGSRLFSVYRTPTRVRFYIITEAGREVTTVLLPEDY